MSSDLGPQAINHPDSAAVFTAAADRARNPVLITMHGSTAVIRTIAGADVWEVAVPAASEAFICALNGEYMMVKADLDQDNALRMALTGR